MSDLIKFVNARLDEIEDSAYHAQGVLGVKNAWWKGEDLKARFPDLTRADRQHIEIHSPDAVFADIKFKRNLLELFAISNEEGFGGADGWVLIRDAVYQLAALWSDHKDYNPGWRTK